MNFLILSITAGEGHNSTARAIRAELEKRAQALAQAAGETERLLLNLLEGK